VSFAEALRLELVARGADIGVTLVCPAGVPTNLNAAIRGNRAVSRSSPADWVSAEEVAKQVIDAVRRGDFYLFTHASSAERVRRYQQAVLDSFA
jgi:short-subunit dehydrogenase